MTKTYNRQKNILIIFILSTLLIFISGVSYYIYNTQHQSMVHEERNIIKTETDLLGDFLVDLLIRHDYAESKNFLQAWASKNSSISLLKVDLKNNKNLFSYNDSVPSDIIFEKEFHQQGITFTIQIGHTLKKADKMPTGLKRMLLGFTILLTIIIGAGLWLILSKWILRPMNAEIEHQTKKLKDYSLKLEKLNRLYEELSVTDQLTGIFNRRKIDETLRYELERAKRYDTPLSLMMLDIDHFKQVNDTHGHSVGDTTLKEFTGILSKNIRTTDLLGRWGGEEFIIVLPDTTLEHACVLAERIRTDVESHTFPTIKTKTCSLGVTSFQPQDSAESIIERVDTALYEAKNNGRNQVRHK